MKKNINLLLFFVTLAYFLNTPVFSQLSGSYTIGSGGNYPDISTAVNSLISEGINGPVSFNIKSGNYHESVLLDSVRGASSVNTITIKSLSGNSSDVNWYPENSSEYNYTFKIRKADYVIIKNITFPKGTTSSSADKNRIYITGDINDLKIIENNFLGEISKDNGLFSENAKNINLFIKGNSFNLKNGIVFKENYSFISNNSYVAENDFNCNRGIEISNHNNLTIEKNVLRSVNVLNAGFPSASCIRVASCLGSLKIIKNKINCLGYIDAIDGIVVSFCQEANVLVANNFISLKSGTGMWIEVCTNVKVYFNTINTAHVNSGDITFLQCTGTISRNNIMVNLANQGTQSLTYYLISSTFSYSDYNVFFYINPYILYGSNIGYMNNLQQFRLQTGLDMHSLEIPVYFISDTNLHLTGSSLSDSRLRGIPLPEVTDDIDGISRNPSLPTIGAHEILLTSVNNSIENIPEKYSLHQNYPNPFNPSTQIVYDIPKQGFVSLKVFDILGKEIAELVNENQNAGSYRVDFNAGNLSAGIYFYSIHAGDFRSVMKMSLIK